MSKKTDGISDWRQMKNIDDAISLVDRGVVLRWSAAKTVAKILNTDEQRQLVDYLAKQFCDRYEMRLSAEIIVESLLVWLAANANEKEIGYVLERLFEHPACESAFYHLIDIIMNFETVEKTHQEQVFCMGILCLCELGMAIQQVSQAYPDLLKDHQKLLSHLSAYLLSVSNVANNCVRLGLMNYFGVVEMNTNRENFHKVMNRFGHTVLDHLFTLLFDKKTEAVSLRFLLDNFSYVLDTNNDVQKTVYDTLKFYMLKQPERFMLFIESLMREGSQEDGIEFTDRSKSMLFIHLLLLFRVANEVGHRKLGTDLMHCVSQFKDLPEFAESIQDLQRDISIRPTFKEIIQAIGLGQKTSRAELKVLRSGKRGRKPSFAKQPTMLTSEQIVYLGSIEIAKAS